eukprot:1835842-Amphidinium_carterae.1
MASASYTSVPLSSRKDDRLNYLLMMSAAISSTERMGWVGLSWQRFRYATSVQSLTRTVVW